MTLDELNLKFAILQFKSDAKTRQRLWKKLAKLIKDGIPIISALTEIRGLKKPTAPISIAINDWVMGMNEGKKIADVVKPWVSTEEFMLIMAGEQSGSLDTALDSVVTVSLARSQIKSAVVGGVAYPFFLLLLSFCVLYLFAFKIIPAFTKAARGDAWHGVARVMIDTAHFVQNWIWYCAAAFILILVVFFMSMPHWNSSLRVRLDKYPRYSIYRVMQGSSWLIALSALVQAGTRIELAIEQLSDGASAWANLRMQSALKGLRAGQNLGVALETSGYGFPDPEIISDIRIYSTKSGFDEALKIIGNDWITESVDRIKTLMTIVFGATMMLVGSLIAFVVSGLIAMQLQLTEILQQGVR